MSAERLREAATLLRDRAEGAGIYPCPEWTQQAVWHIARNCEIDCFHDKFDDETNEWVGHPCPSPEGGWDRYETGPFIALMAPPVALALADWLDALADVWSHPMVADLDGDPLAFEGSVDSYAIAVADAILGASA